MDINMDNYCEYGRFNHLIKPQKEPLFLKPDGVRTRYPIGWNGYGRYISGTLRVTYNGLPCNISEEDNGIFYNFDVAPDANTNYDDYEVSYMSRPLDYAFSTGAVEGGYEGEEYFLFPNWNNALNEGDAFWIGKWESHVLYPQASASPPGSKSGCNFWTSIPRYVAINASKFKGNGFSLMRNRQWVSIAQWTDHHNIIVKGNIYGNEIDLDGDSTSLTDIGGGYNPGNGYLVTGRDVPDSWNHNGKPNGIKNMVGNLWEFVDGIENRTGEIYIFDKNNQYIDSGIHIDQISNGTNSDFNAIVDIINSSQNIFNEGIASIINTGSYVPSNLNGEYSWYNKTENNIIMRSGCCTEGLKSGIWAFNVACTNTLANKYIGFRMTRKLI